MPRKLLWSQGDYLMIAAHALPYMPEQEQAATGKNMLPTAVITQRREALKKGMRATLPRSQWRDDDSLRMLVGTNKTGFAFANALKAVRLMTEAQREKLRTAGSMPKPAPGKHGTNTVPYPKRTYAGMVRWTDRELALMARRIKLWKEVQGLDYPMRYFYCMAQEVELPPERRRSQAGITQGDYASSLGAGNAANYQKGVAAIWTIEERYPFDPDRKTWIDPNAPPPAPVELQRLEVITPPEPMPPAPQPSEPAQAPAAPTSPPAPTSSIAEAARAFTMHMQRGIEVLLAAHEQAVLARIAAQVEQLGRNLAEGMVQQLKAGIAGTVHQALEQELGGPVAAPTTAEPPPPGPVADAPAPVPLVVFEIPPEEPNDAEMMKRAGLANDAIMRGQTFGSDSGHHTLPQEQQAPPKFKLKIDVIGLFPRQVEEVRRAINGGCDLTFIDHDHPQHWVPHRADHVIVVSKGVNGLILNRVRKEGVRPLMLGEAGASGVINAINEMKAEAA